MKVLFLNDTSLISGAERCLLDLLATLDAEVEPLVACPPGPLFDAVIDLGVAATPIAEVSGSLRLHPLHTPRALAELAAAALAVRRLAKRRGVDLIHANTQRSCLVAAAARRSGAPPFAAFVHDALPDGRAARMTSAVVRSTASVVFANSAYSADRFGLAHDDARRRVVFNPVDLGTFDPARHSRATARAQLDLGSDDLVLAVIAQITPWKAQLDALLTLSALRREHPRARLLVVGDAKFTAPGTRYDNERYLSELHAVARERGLESCVTWLGERADVPEILAAVDILLVPSWAEPFGRIVVEGLAMGCLVAATSIGGPSEVIDDRVDGLLLAPRDPIGWARALDEMIAQPALSAAIRRAAPPAALRFARVPFARAILDGYKAAVA